MARVGEEGDEVACSHLLYVTMRFQAGHSKMSGVGDLDLACTSSFLPLSSDHLNADPA